MTLTPIILRMYGGAARACTVSAAPDSFFSLEVNPADILLTNALKACSLVPPFLVAVSSCPINLRTDTYTYVDTTRHSASSSQCTQTDALGEEIEKKKRTSNGLHNITLPLGLYPMIEKDGDRKPPDLSLRPAHHLQTDMWANMVGKIPKQNAGTERTCALRGLLNEAKYEDV